MNQTSRDYPGKSHLYPDLLRNEYISSTGVSLVLQNEHIGNTRVSLEKD